MLVAEQTQLCGRADLRHPLAPGLDAIGRAAAKRQRDGVQPPAEPNPCGERIEAGSSLRRVGLQKALEEMVLQHLVGHDRAAVEALPVVAAREFRGQISSSWSNSFGLTGLSR